MLNSADRNSLFRDNTDMQNNRSFLMIGANCEEFYLPLLKAGKVQYVHNSSSFNAFFTHPKNEFSRIDLTLIDIDQEEKSLLEYISVIKQNKRLLGECIGITKGEVGSLVQKALKLGLKDLYNVNDDPQMIVRRSDMIKQLKDRNIDFISEDEKILETKTRISLRKRMFDVFFASLALVAASPFMVLIAILIKIESKGPVFFISPRAGTGFRIFNFYKFRSMKTGSDVKLHELLQYNQYGQKAEVSSFFKLKDDPRVTRIGWLLRKTSLDELPQLFNVIKGDMSIVGNRPLPLYEAELLTKDEIIKRFFAPAGITGLWQVSKRGKKEMSAEERLALDVSYADLRNGWYDLRIIWKTIPAMIQEETV